MGEALGDGCADGRLLQGGLHHGARRDMHDRAAVSLDAQDKSKLALCGRQEADVDLGFGEGFQRGEQFVLQLGVFIDGEIHGMAEKYSDVILQFVITPEFHLLLRNEDSCSSTTGFCGQLHPDGFCRLPRILLLSW